MKSLMSMRTATYAGKSSQHLRSGMRQGAAWKSFRSYHAQ